MTLTLEIALTHIRSRLRQTVVGVLGVAVGVGFSVMMAALMEGSQRDFIAQLVDTLPHITVSDEVRDPPPQPAEADYAAVSVLGLRTPDRRRGIKNPLAIIATLEGWLPGAVAPSVRVNAIVRSGGRDLPASVIGIDPRREPSVSPIESQIKVGALADLSTASNAIILGDGLADRIGARVGTTLTLSSAEGRAMTATVAGLFHSGVAQIDRSQAYVLLRTGQVLAGQTGLVNELRLRLHDVLAARVIAGRIEAQTGYKSVSWQEAQEDLLAAFEIRNIIMYTVVGAILLVASFGTYNIISTITHEKTRDIAIMKSLGLRASMVRNIFVAESAAIGVTGVIVGWGLGFLLCLGLAQIEFKSPFQDSNRLPIFYSASHYALAGAIGLIASVLAAWFPASKAASVHPVDIIRGAS